jgi:hypothetical protein
MFIKIFAQNILLPKNEESELIFLKNIHEYIIVLFTI